MNLVLYDPLPIANEYLSTIYFQSLENYARDIGKPLNRIASLQDVGNSTVLTHGDYLKPEVILQLKNNGNKIISFDINDSSWPIGAFRSTDKFQLDDEWLLIDRVFKLSGIQKKNVCQDYAIDSDFNFSLVDKEFLPEESWVKYKQMADSGKMTSLPYVPWHHQDVARHLPYGERTGKVLCRGGNHFARFVVFLWLLMHGKADPMTSFATADYYRGDMNPAFKYCEPCRAERGGFGYTPIISGTSGDQCNSPAPWGGRLDLTTPNLWNNRCPKSFFWLAEKFREKYNCNAPREIEHALNGHYESAAAFMLALSHATMYADLKWIFSIYVPPRFWEAASCRTVNFLPARTNDQTYFPHVEEGFHYLTFSEDFVGFNPTVNELQFNEITGNCAELYSTWIRGTQYRIATKLVEKIFGECEGVANAS
jgi:hypothetical protein